MPGRGRWLKRQRREERRIKDRDLLKTVEEVFDSFTVSLLYKLLSKGVIKELKGVVNAGKEARVYLGVLRDGSYAAVKIYLSFTAEFRKSIRKYIEGDPRFENIPKNNFRKLIYEWTRKEFRNLKRLHEKGVRVPRPIAYMGNILVMEFIGEDGLRAPLLVEIAGELGREEMYNVYLDVVNQVEGIVCRAGLVHADLSEYNLMIYNDRVWVIDVSQAVHYNHPHADEFLDRDLSNIYTFFSRYIDMSGWRDVEKRIRGCLKAWREGKLDQESM
ncbi:MAG: serine protein kinase RIO [Desulfurococcales archaeon]|nr:serine protein kinase RIO [Desulfurococcales archaeon]